MLLKRGWNFWRQTLALLPVLVNGFSSGSHLLWLSNATYYLTKPGHVPSATVDECGYIGSMMQLATLVFCFPAGFLVDRFGRKNVVIAGGIINLVASFLLIVGNDLILIYISRFVSGIGYAVIICSGLAITSELSSPEFRGTFFALTAIIKRVSTLSQSVVSVVYSSYDAIAVSTILVCVLIFPTACCLPESPYFLINAGKSAEAKNIYRKMHPDQNEAQIDEMFDHLLKLTEADRLKRSELNFWQFVKQKAVLKAVFLGILLRSIPALCGVLIITSYLTIILPETRFVSNDYYPLIVCLCGMCAQITSIAFIEKFPRRTLFLFTSLLDAATLFCLGVIYHLGLEKRSEIWRWILIGATTANITIGEAVLLPLADTVPSELFPLRIKGQASAFTVLTRSIFAIAGLTLFNVITTNVGIYANFYLYGVAMVGLSAIIYFFLPETGGKTLAQVQTDLQ